MTDQIKSGGELLACPFCGSPALAGQTLDGAWYAMCQEDKCLRIDNYWRTRSEAITAWNTRTPHTPEGGRVKEEQARSGPGARGNLDVLAVRAILAAAYEADEAPQRDVDGYRSGAFDQDRTFKAALAVYRQFKASDGVDTARGAASRVLHDKVHAEARAIHLKDMTQSGYDFWVVRVAAEHGARIALAALHGDQEKEQ